MKKFFEDFKAFAMRGNVIDMAVGVIIGAAFGSITTSLVNDIFMPLIGVLTGGINFGGLFIAQGIARFLHRRFNLGTDVIVGIDYQFFGGEQHLHLIHACKLAHGIFYLARTGGAVHAADFPAIAGAGDVFRERWRAGTCAVAATVVGVLYRG